MISLYHTYSKVSEFKDVIELIACCKQAEFATQNVEKRTTSVSAKAGHQIHSVLEIQLRSPLQ